jgi:hypothetical protein
MTHLTDEQLLDAAELEREYDSPTASHLAACAACRGRLEELRTMLDAARTAADIHEPSPLFWDHFSARVDEAITDEPDPPSWGFRRFAWTIGAAIAAALLIAVSITTNRGAMSPEIAVTDRVPPESAPSGPLDLADDDSWQLIADLTPALEWDDVDETDIVRPGTSERALQALSDAERVELQRLLRIEMSERAPGS